MASANSCNSVLDLHLIILNKEFWLPQDSVCILSYDIVLSTHLIIQRERKGLWPDWSKSHQDKPIGLIWVTRKEIEKEGEGEEGRRVRGGNKGYWVLVAEMLRIWTPYKVWRAGSTSKFKAEADTKSSRKTTKSIAQKSPKYSYNIIWAQNNWIPGFYNGRQTPVLWEITWSQDLFFPSSSGCFLLQIFMYFIYVCQHVFM